MNEDISIGQVQIKHSGTKNVYATREFHCDSIFIEPISSCWRFVKFSYGVDMCLCKFVIVSMCWKGKQTELGALPTPDEKAW